MSVLRERFHELARSNQAFYHRFPGYQKPHRLRTPTRLLPFEFEYHSPLQDLEVFESLIIDDYVILVFAILLHVLFDF